MNLRVTGGKSKGMSLDVSRDVSRPIMDRIRISVFSLLKDYLQDANVLDVYAGSGAMGIESLSRGASTCLFIEKDKNATEAIKKNIGKLGYLKQTRVLQTEIEKYFWKIESEDSLEQFDIIFIDPPFTTIHVVNLVPYCSILSDSGIIALRVPSDYFRNKKSKIRPGDLEEIYTKKYGMSQMVFYRKKV